MARRYELPAHEREAFRLIAQGVAGARGLLVDRALDGRLFYCPGTPGSYAFFDDVAMRPDRIEFGSRQSPYVMAHELGHAYHGFYFPHETARMAQPEDDRAEAVALLFEWELRAYADRQWKHSPPPRHEVFEYLSGSMWESRQAQYRLLENRAPFDILENVLQTAPRTVDLHELVARIVTGAEGHAA